MNFVRKINFGKLNKICLNSGQDVITNIQSVSFHCCAVDRGKFLDTKRQSKIFGKLYGERIAGRKKRWFPTSESGATQQNVSFSPAGFGKTIGKGKGGKGNARRMTVLNKLFMEHITSLLATGEASERILNRGLQITRVKISVDYTNITVYWLGSENSQFDAELELELQRCTGILRHELSQLELMGVVPRIHFVRDRNHASLYLVDEVLSKIKPEFDDDHERLDPNIMAKKEFFGEDALEIETCEIPKMRQDVFGLNHEEILLKILTKMRKSKQAWSLHNKEQETEQDKMETKLNE